MTHLLRRVWSRHRPRRGLPAGLPVLPPGFDLDKERQARLDAGLAEYLNANDLYPDVRPCLQEPREAGYFLGVAGNQTARVGRFVRELNPVDVIATSDDWGVSKPDAAFFEKLVEVSGHQPDEIVYVGDRLDNDITLAAKAGLLAAFVCRGPWGFILEQSVKTTAPDIQVASLFELREAIEAK